MERFIRILGNNLQKTAGTDYNLSRNRFTFEFLTVTLSTHRLGPSGGPFLVPPRKGERMRLKEALKGLLPQTNPPSLRILPARSSFREAGFRHFLRKHPHDKLIPCQCAHWRGIVDHFGFWNDCREQSPFVDFSAFSRNAPWRSPTQWVRQITQFHSAQIGAFSAPEVP